MGEFYRMTASLVGHNKEGAFATHHERQKVLRSFAQHCEQKFHLRTLDQVKFRHIESQVNDWKQAALSPSTLHTRLSHLRWFVEKIDKHPLLDVIKERIDLPARHQAHGKNLAWEKENHASIDRIRDPHVKMCLKVELAFGLRAEEARKLQPHEVDKAEKIVIYRGTKGGKEREIVIKNPIQRELLDEAKRLVGPGQTLIPSRYSREISFVHFYYKVLRRAGITKAKLGITSHGLRHEYVHRTYEALTGAKVLKGEDGKVRYENYPSPEKDLEARRLIASWLGHERIDITYVYLPKP